MTTISWLFIMGFILIQCTLGIVLLYRGFALALETFKVESFVSWMAVAGERLKTVFPFAPRTTLLVALLVPGSITLLLLAALWHLARLGMPWSLEERRKRF